MTSNDAAPLPSKARCAPKLAFSTLIALIFPGMILRRQASFIIDGDAIGSFPRDILNRRDSIFLSRLSRG